jgi:hypothetical protein
MSSHKEAPGLSSDPAADNTDVYAFVSPDKPSTVTLIANFVPLEDPAGGPNFYEFSDDVLYEIHVDNNGDGVPNVTYQFRFTTEYTTPLSFLYNTGPIATIDSANWNRKQFYTVTRIVGVTSTVLGTHLACPPCNVGPTSTPNYATLASAAVHDLGTNHIVFAGQRAEGFYVDLGAIFDLGDLRPLQNLHVGSQMPQSGGVNGTKAKNVHSIAIQVPKTELTAGNVDPVPSDYNLATSVIGVFATASRQSSRVLAGDGTANLAGGWIQISRLGNPLINEVVIPVGQKNFFNSQSPSGDSQFATFVAHPELAKLLPVLYPGAFPNLAAIVASDDSRDDLVAILLTGLPSGLIANFQNNTGMTKADMLRLNVAIVPTTVNPSNLGLLGSDLAGFPNGRRVFDDVTVIELRAIAGAVYKLVKPSFDPDAAVPAITQGLTSSNTDVTASNTVHYLTVFPYLGTPHSGYFTPADNAPAPDLGPQSAPLGQVTVVPVGAPQTGGGSTAGIQDKGLLVTGGVALAGAAVLAGRLAGWGSDATEGDNADVEVSAP